MAEQFPDSRIERIGPVLSVGDVIPSHNPQCFGCGSDAVAGLRMSMTVSGSDELTGRFRVTAEHQGGPGLIHGGILAAAFDEVLGGLNWLLGYPAVTAHLATNFRRPVPVGTDVELVGRMDDVSGRKVRVSARACDAATGVELADASALFIRVPMAHFRRHGRKQEVLAVFGEQEEPATGEAPGYGRVRNPGSATVGSPGAERVREG